MAKSKPVDADVETELVEGVSKSGPCVRKERSDCIKKSQWQTFLDHLAMTCNARAAAREAGIYNTSAYRRRERDPVFAQQWDKARETGMATVKMMLVARAMGTHGYEPGEDFAPDPAKMDPELSYKLIAQYEKTDAKIGRGGGARVPVAASEDDACGEILKRLKVLGIRLKQESQ